MTEELSILASTSTEEDRHTSHICDHNICDNMRTMDVGRFDWLLLIVVCVVATLMQSTEVASQFCSDYELQNNCTRCNDAPGCTYCADSSAAGGSCVQSGECSSDQVRNSTDDCACYLSQTCDECLSDTQDGRCGFCSSGGYFGTTCKPLRDRGLGLCTTRAWYTDKTACPCVSATTCVESVVANKDAGGCGWCEYGYYSVSFPLPQQLQRCPSASGLPTIASVAGCSCLEEMNCANCTAVPGCAYCMGSQTCLPTAALPSAMCATSHLSVEYGDANVDHVCSAWDRCFPGKGAGDNCNQCTARSESGCGWCGNQCVAVDSATGDAVLPGWCDGLPFTTPQACNCTSYTTCESCVEQGDTCGHCPFSKSSSSCQPLPLDGDSPNAVLAVNREDCLCSAATTCGDCVAANGCAWCSATNQCLTKDKQFNVACGVPGKTTGIVKIDTQQQCDAIAAQTCVACIKLEGTWCASFSTCLLEDQVEHSCTLSSVVTDNVDGICEALEHCHQRGRDCQSCLSDSQCGVCLGLKAGSTDCHPVGADGLPRLPGTCSKQQTFVHGSDGLQSCNDFVTCAILSRNCTLCSTTNGCDPCYGPFSQFDPPMQMLCLPEAEGGLCTDFPVNNDFERYSLLSTPPQCDLVEDIFGTECVLQSTCQTCAELPHCTWCLQQEICMALPKGSPHPPPTNFKVGLPGGIKCGLPLQGKGECCSLVPAIFNDSAWTLAVVQGSLFGALMFVIMTYWTYHARRRRPVRSRYSGTMLVLVVFTWQFELARLLKYVSLRLSVFTPTIALIGGILITDMPLLLLALGTHFATVGKDPSRLRKLLTAPMTAFQDKRGRLTSLFAFSALLPSAFSIVLAPNKAFSVLGVLSFVLHVSVMLLVSIEDPKVAFSAFNAKGRTLSFVAGHFDLRPKMLMWIYFSGWTFAVTALCFVFATSVTRYNHYNSSAAALADKFIQDQLQATILSTQLPQPIRSCSGQRVANDADLPQAATTSNCLSPEPLYEVGLIALLLMVGVFPIQLMGGELRQLLSSLRKGGGQDGNGDRVNNMDVASQANCSAESRSIELMVIESNENEQQSPPRITLNVAVGVSRVEKVARRLTSTYSLAPVATTSALFAMAMAFVSKPKDETWRWWFAVFLIIVMGLRSITLQYAIANFKSPRFEWKPVPMLQNHRGKINKAFTAIKFIGQSWHWRQALAGANNFMSLLYFVVVLSLAPSTDVGSEIARKSGLVISLLGFVVNVYAIFANVRPRWKFFPSDDSFRLTTLLKTVMLVVKAFLVSRAARTKTFDGYTGRQEAQSSEQVVAQAALIVIFIVTFVFLSLITLVGARRLWLDRAKQLAGLPSKRLFILGHIFSWLWVRIAILIIAIVPDLRPDWLLDPAFLPLLILSLAVVLAAYSDNETAHFLQATQLRQDDMTMERSGMSDADHGTEEILKSSSSPLSSTPNANVNSSTALTSTRHRMVPSTRAMHESARGLHAHNSVTALVVWILILVTGALILMAPLLNGVATALVQTAHPPISVRGNQMVIILLSALWLRCLLLGRAFRRDIRRSQEGHGRDQSLASMTPAPTVSENHGDDVIDIQIRDQPQESEGSTAACLYASGNFDQTDDGRDQVAVEAVEAHRLEEDGDGDSVSVIQVDVA